MKLPCVSFVFAVAAEAAWTSTPNSNSSPEFLEKVSPHRREGPSESFVQLPKYLRENGVSTAHMKHKAPYQGDQSIPATSAQDPPEEEESIDYIPEVQSGERSNFVLVGDDHGPSDHSHDDPATLEEGADEQDLVHPDDEKHDDARLQGDDNENAHLDENAHPTEAHVDEASVHADDAHDEEHSDEHSDDEHNEGLSHADDSHGEEHSDEHSDGDEHSDAHGSHEDGHSEEDGHSHGHSEDDGHGNSHSEDDGHGNSHSEDDEDQPSEKVYYGPQGCVSVHRSGEGTCIMQTRCKPGSTSNYEFGLICIDASASSVRHFFGKDSFDSEEKFDTRIKCNQCIGLETMNHQADMSEKVTKLSSEVVEMRKMLKNITTNVEEVKKVNSAALAGTSTASTSAEESGDDDDATFGSGPSPSPAVVPPSPAAEEVHFIGRKHHANGHVRRIHRHSQNVRH